MKTYCVVKDGAVKVREPGEVAPDGVVWFRQGLVAVVLRAECGRLFVDPEVAQAKPRSVPAECLGKLGLNPGGVRIVEAEVFDEERNVAKRSAFDAEMAALEGAVPGVTEMLRVEAQLTSEEDRYERELSRLLNDEQNDGVRPPRPLNSRLNADLFALQDANPRAALYLKAKRQSEACSWADNTGSGAAGREAMRVLRAGGTTEEAETALAKRREWVD